MKAGWTLIPHSWAGESWELLFNNLPSPVEADADKRQGVHLILQAAHAVTVVFPVTSSKGKRDCRKLHSDVKTRYEKMLSSLASCQSPCWPCLVSLGSCQPPRSDFVHPSAAAPRLWPSLWSAVWGRLPGSSPFMLPTPCKSALSKISPSNICCAYISFFSLDRLGTPINLLVYLADISMCPTLLIQDADVIIISWNIR